MIDWSTPLENEEIDWSSPVETPSRNKKPFPGKGLALGLAQGLENYIKGMASHGAEPEVDIPDFLRHERLRNKPELDRTNTPSFNFEQYVDPSQHFQFKVGEYAPEIFGGAMLGKAAIKGLSKLTGKSIGGAIVKDVKDIKKSLSKEYNDIFDIGGIGEKEIKTKVPTSELEQILSNVDKKFYSGLQSFLNNPTARNAHRAQSDLGKLTRKLQGKRELVTAEHETLKNARNAQDILKQEIYDALLREGGLELPFRYADVTKRFAQNLVPYLENTAVRRASLKPGQKGYLNPSRLPQKLKTESGDALMANLRGKMEGTNAPINPYLYGKYPLLGINQALTSPGARHVLSMIGLGSGGYGTYELLKSLMRGD